MSSGESAADKVRGLFSGGSEKSEGVRENINSFADELVDPNQNKGSTTSSDAKPYTTGTTSMGGTHSAPSDGSRTLTGGSEKEMGSSGFNTDAEKLGEGLREGVGKMMKK